MSACGRNSAFNSSYQTSRPGAGCAGNRAVSVSLGLEVVFMPLEATGK